MGDGDDSGAKQPFPPWLRELCYFGGLIITLAVFMMNLKSDQRSTREELLRLAGDVSAIRASIPNRDVYDLKLSDLQRQIDQNKSAGEFEIAKLVKFKEEVTKDLIRKGVM